MKFKTIVLAAAVSLPMLAKGNASSSSPFAEERQASITLDCFDRATDKLGEIIDTKGAKAGDAWWYGDGRAVFMLQCKDGIAKAKPSSLGRSEVARSNSDCSILSHKIDARKSKWKPGDSKDVIQSFRRAWQRNGCEVQQVKNAPAGAAS